MSSITWMEIGLALFFFPPLPLWQPRNQVNWCSSDTNGSIEPSVLPRHPLPLPHLSLSLFISLTHHSLPLLSFSAPALDVFSPRQRRQFPYRITTRIRWPGFDSQSVPHPQPHPHKWKCICVCVSVCACIVQMWAAPLPGENAARLQCAVLVLVALGKSDRQQSRGEITEM